VSCLKRSIRRAEKFVILEIATDDLPGMLRL
jgi:hypothetical protein